MPKYAQNLTLKEIKSISKPGMYSIGYVPGLCVRVTTIKISYYFRYQIQRIPKAVIIGDIKYITLNQAKATAHNYRALILMGKDPALEKKAQKEQLHKELQNNQQKRKLIHSSSFAIVAKKYVDYKKDSGAFQYNKRAESDYNSMLRTHVYPIIQNKPIATVTIYEIRDILAKVWDKTSLPKKLTGLLKQIFDWAKAMKYIPANQPNPADMDGPLKVLMEPYRRNRKEEEHLPALDYKEIPDITVSLDESIDKLQIIQKLKEGKFKEMIESDLNSSELSLRPTLEKYFKMFAPYLFDRSHEFWQTFISTLSKIFNCEGNILMKAMDLLAIHLLYQPNIPKNSDGPFDNSFSHSEAITEYLNGMKTEYTFYDENNKIISKSSTLQMPIDSETRKGFLNSPKDFIERIEKLNKF